MSITSPSQNYFTNYIVSSQLNSSGTSFIMDFIKVYIAICIILLILLIWTYVMMYKLFEKLGIKGWKALIPFYNSWLFLEKIGLPPILGVIPGVQAIAMIIAYYKYGQSIGKSKLFSVLLAIIPPVMLTIIVLSKDKNVPINSYEKDESKQFSPISDTQVVSEQQNMIGGIQQGTLQQLMSVENNDTQITSQQNIMEEIQLNESPRPNSIPNIQPINQQQNIIVETQSNESPQTNSILNIQPINQQQSMIQSNQNQQLRDNQLNNMSNEQIKINNQENEFIRCKRCGTNIKKENKVCFICGTPIE